QEKLEVLQQQLTEHSQQQMQCRSELDRIVGRLQSNRRACQQLSSSLAKHQKSGEYYQRLLSLSQTASGELAGKPKLAFEQYIQAFYFEHVLHAANQRLNTLSRGQYTLMRRTQAENLRSAEGLEIEVMDHYTGRKRPVSSLSGGESFQAALSLALGLSDVIQSFAGGIEVDAVFIDEGFGSLDQQALTQALETLAGLSGGDRLVGIISHVEALKDRIPHRVEVTKTMNGSHIHQNRA
ncbi:MAG: SMC family ATPase, partial [Firmicutes bacterium]|nr:SMC family ATPase [Bacillota bacterium]